RTSLAPPTAQRSLYKYDARINLKKQNYSIITVNSVGLRSEPSAQARQQPLALLERQRFAGALLASAARLGRTVCSWPKPRFISAASGVVWHRPESGRSTTAPSQATFSENQNVPTRLARGRGRCRAHGPCRSSSTRSRRNLCPRASRLCGRDRSCRRQG